MKLMIRWGAVVMLVLGLMLSAAAIFGFGTTDDLPKAEPIPEYTSYYHIAANFVKFDGTYHHITFIPRNELCACKFDILERKIVCHCVEEKYPEVR